MFWEGVSNMDTPPSESHLQGNLFFWHNLISIIHHSMLQGFFHKIGIGRVAWQGFLYFPKGQKMSMSDFKWWTDMVFILSNGSFILKVALPWISLKYVWEVFDAIKAAVKVKWVWNYCIWSPPSFSSSCSHFSSPAIWVHLT